MNNIFKNRYDLKSKFKSQKNMFAGWISFSHPSITEIFANMSIDFIAIDMEHSTISIEQSQRIIAASQSYNVPCLPRPVSHSNDFFKPILDSGADGLIVSTVESGSQVIDIVNNIKFPDIGKRTYGVNRAHNYGFDTLRYYQEWNNSSSIILQIETKKGLENLDDLLKYEQVDAIMVGPYDLSGSLGVPGQFENKIYIEACSEIIGLSKKYKKSCGTQISKVDKNIITKNLELGFNFIVLGSDLFVLSDWADTTNKLINEIL